MDKFKKGIKKLLKDKTIKLIIFVFIGLIVLGVVISQANRIKIAQYNSEGQDPLEINENGDMTGENVQGAREEELENGSYYILHNDRFYPLMGSIATNYETNEDATGSSTYRLNMTTIEYGQQIPTLYLENGDKLIYYDVQYPLSYAVFERFVDEGISVGAYSFYYDEYNGSYRFSISGEDDFPAIFTASSAAQLLNGLPKDEEESKKRGEKKEEDNISFFTITDIGGVEMGRDQLKSVGIIKNLEPGESYNTSIYNGTNYNNYVMTADTWFFSGLEAYATSEVPLEKKMYQTINIPEYLKDGYYNVNNVGLFRLVHGSTWNTNMDLSSRLLATNQEENKGYDSASLEKSQYFEPAITTGRYSENPKLNTYKTTNPSAFGYVAEDDKTKEGTTFVDYERHEGQTPQPVDGTATSGTDNNKTENNKVEENKTSSSSSSASTSSDTASSSATSSATQDTSQETSQRRTRE